MDTGDILARLVAFETVSVLPNRALIDWVAELLASAGIASKVIPDATGHKANLFATVGRGRGVMLSGPFRCGPGGGAGLDPSALCLDHRRRALFRPRRLRHEGVRGLCHRRDAQGRPEGFAHTPASGAEL